MTGSSNLGACFCAFMYTSKQWKTSLLLTFPLATKLVRNSETSGFFTIDDGVFESGCTFQTMMHGNKSRRFSLNVSCMSVSQDESCMKEERALFFCTEFSEIVQPSKWNVRADWTKRASVALLLSRHQCDCPIVVELLLLEYYIPIEYDDEVRSSMSARITESMSSSQC